MYYKYTHHFRKDYKRVDWLSIMKTKPRSHVQVVKDDNNEVIEGECVFQLDALVDPYRALHNEGYLLSCINNFIFYIYQAFVVEEYGFK